MLDARCDRTFITCCLLAASCFVTKMFGRRNWKTQKARFVRYVRRQQSCPTATFQLDRRESKLLAIEVGRCCDGFDELVGGPSRTLLFVSF
ncbi:hypothetical protein K440DRAFT_370600 [Wilcoxina mikolae CBS 423.85]|nr:hypothetical protein K440DRAFT_370600 [Wilcoxina mikolae CBS 423.85]